MSTGALTLVPQTSINSGKKFRLRLCNIYIPASGNQGVSGSLKIIGESILLAELASTSKLAFPVSGFFGLVESVSLSKKYMGTGSTTEFTFTIKPKS